MKHNQFRLFINNSPRKAYCADDVSKIKVRKIEQALAYRYIQPNDFNSKLWLVFDIDRPTSPDEITDDIGLPAPHYFVQNKINQRAHVFYGLETAVHLNSNSSAAARRFAAAVDVGMTLALDADASYAGLIAKNPTHEHWRVWSCSGERYQLADLAEYVDLSPYQDKRKNMPGIGLGRNHNLFDTLRRWSYRAIRQGWPDLNAWIRACEQRAAAYNIQFHAPLHEMEVKHLARSVARFTHRTFSPSDFSLWQANQGRKGGIAKGEAYREIRDRALLMYSEGLSFEKIANSIGCSPRSVSNWVKKRY